ncbi:cellobiose phosphorylase [Bacillus coahuilensis m2-6]|uniref:hypothetical protein n=1 Tax=Bacillus coahuilensis TaxID=408580 RepID=UPI00018508ED|nr:hypothetical protein [Bacillus coahuilensis]KUP09764.1 cellobiose phosphorylase [Bacillus coahuilensis m2-6]
MRQPSYFFDENKRFVIEEFDRATPFSSFLPGIAGLKGIPMWTFYVNRGQVISSFGIGDKDSPIMEFTPANGAYKSVPTSGFRTFIKLKHSSEIYEPFRPLKNEQHIKRKMYIEAGQVSIEEINLELNLKIVIHYFHMPEANFAGLVRKVEVTNLGNEPIQFEVVDGAPEILPYGVTNAAYKEVGNLMRSWMEVYNQENRIPFYRVRASIGDEAEVSEVTGGHFYLSFSDEEELIQPIVDTTILFGEDTALHYPEEFDRLSLESLTKQSQVTANKVPCGFTPVQRSLQPNASTTIWTMIGHVKEIEIVQNHVPKIVSLSYMEAKQKRSEEIIRSLTDSIDTHSSSELFNEYARQSYLDNMLRGGYPHILENGQDGFVYHLFSRKHGDLERDYNFFNIAPEFYSQGNGNFRDANQNRRSDIYFNPNVKSFNVKMFMSLIQADGYNPLSVKGCSFNVKESAKSMIPEMITKHLQQGDDRLRKLLEGAFTPGQISTLVDTLGLTYRTNEESFFLDVFTVAEQEIEANFGEGYWVDHWTYNMDLVDSYLDVYPDRKDTFLFGEKDYKFFDSPAQVLPRSEKYVLTKEGTVRQYGSVIEDEEKMDRLGMNINSTHWMKTEQGQGEVYTTNLFVKLLSLSLVKFSTLDPAGIGIEMEANKPGWNDALNGLPGIFGSGVSETLELKRMVQFINSSIKAYGHQQVQIPVEIFTLLQGVGEELQKLKSEQISEFDYWDAVSSLRETYRSTIRFGFAGDEKVVSLQELASLYELLEEKLTVGIDKAVELGEGLTPTYLTYEVDEFEQVLDPNGNPVMSGYGLPKVKITKLSAPKPLPHFLEGPARMYKTFKDVERARSIHEKVKETDLYDPVIHMFKTSVSLDEQSHEIGRIKAFTPGWLERESVFLHMSYKYVLELIKSGLYDEYYEEIKTSLVPFLDPAVYGRSTLENSSFLASSSNPDPSTHGRGYVARLSGSTAEFLSMWKTMMMGHTLYSVQGGQLTLSLSPILPKWLFTEEGTLSFMLFGTTKVTYHNVSGIDTFGENGAVVKGYKLTFKDGRTVHVEAASVIGADAQAVRDGEIVEIEVTLG